MISNIGISSSDLNSLEEEPFIDKIKYAMKILVEKKVDSFIFHSKKKNYIHLLFTVDIFATKR